jgi:hypothetical protein
VDLSRGESFGYLGFDFRRIRSERGVLSRSTLFHGLRCAVIDGRSGPTRSHMPRVSSGVSFSHLKTVLNFPMMWQAPPSPDPDQDAAVLGPIKAAPFGWPRRRGQP